ncbi:hypothetical protein BSNK01_30580 [Bacillaceae bacterium]
MYKKFKRYKIGLLVMLVLTIHGNAYSAGPMQELDVKLQLNGTETNFDGVYVYEDITMVPLRGIFELLGAEVVWDHANKRITVKNDENIIMLSLNEKTAFVNGKPEKLDVYPRVIAGRVTVPLRFISEALGATVEWDKENKKIIVSSSTDHASHNAGYAGKGEKIIQQEKQSNQEQEASLLPIEKAVEMAIKQSNELRKAEKEIERANEMLEEATEHIDFIPSDGQNPVAAKAFTNWSKAQTAYFISKRQYEIAKEKLEYTVKKAYHDVLRKEQEKEVAELALEDADWKRQTAKAKFEQGMASEYELQQAERNVKEAQAKREAAVKALEDAWQKLNQLIGAKPNDRFTLQNSVIFEKMEDIDLETHITRVISSSPVVWLAEQNAQMAELDLDYYNFNDPTREPYEVERIDLESSKLSVEETKEKLESSLRNMYFTILQLEEQYDALTTNLDKARSNLQLVQSKYEVGMATAEELLSARLASEEIEKNMLNIVLQLDELKAAFAKPWVLG